MARRPTSFLVDTDILIDYLTGVERMKAILESPRSKVYYSPVTRKELLAKPGLSSTERTKIWMLLLKHRLFPIDKRTAEYFSRLLLKYARLGLRKGDALVAATAWARRLPLLTRNTRHYRFISEITLVDLSDF